MPPELEHTMLWGLTWANIIAFSGIFLNFLWNYVNSVSARRTRRNTLALDHFGYAVRGPLQELIIALGGHMDAADDIVIGAGQFQIQLAAVAELRKSFHGTRRKLARLLTDYDESPLVEGNGWAALEHEDMDIATNALMQATRSADADQLRTALLDFVRSVNDLRMRLISHLDNCAGGLMK